MAGAVVTIIVRAVASAAFGFYLAHYASYNRVYGTLGAAVAFLVWLWIMNIATLVGVEINRALEMRSTHGARAAAGDAEARPASLDAMNAADESPAAGRQAAPQDVSDDYNRAETGGQSTAGPQHPRSPRDLPHA
jgi:membrane protein